MSDTDLIAYAAVLVALLAAWYARGARNEARRANDISLHQHHRPQRLAVYVAMRQFATFCAGYRTAQTLGNAIGTQQLSGAISNFRWEIEQHGPLGVVEVESLAKTYENSAWNLQRLLDRSAAGQSQPLDPKYSSATEHADAIVDWFATQPDELRKVFAPYLSAA